MDFIEFEEVGRTFTCRAASSPATPGTLWWWVSVSGESQRYAAFRTAPTDNSRNLRTRIVAYYEQLLADRARPVQTKAHWAQRRPARPVEAPAAAAEAPAQVEPSET
jgi:hypothetical protein